MDARAIVVGTDGTASSKAAVRWAAREAARQDRPLRIAHAFDWEWRESRYDIGSEYLDMARKIAEAITANAVDQAREVAPAITIETDILLGHAAPRLLAAADHAPLIVLGNRGRGGFASLMLGSVSQRVSAHARCPVVIVRGRGDTTDGPIAVGVDDSPAADHVLETAFDLAAARGAALAVVRAYLPPLPVWLRTNVPAAEVDTPDQDAAEHARLDQLVAPWRAKYPDVPVETMLSHDSAAAVMVGVSHGSQLVVVGSRNHGAIAGALVGSTGEQLLHHADCPVYIARQPRSSDAQR